MATQNTTPSATGRAAHLRLVPADGRAFRRLRKPKKGRWPHGLDPERLVKEAADLRARAEHLAEITSVAADAARGGQTVVRVALTREAAMAGRWSAQSMRLVADTLEAVSQMLVEAETAKVGRTG